MALRLSVRCSFRLPRLRARPQARRRFPTPPCFSQPLSSLPIRSWIRWMNTLPPWAHRWEARRSRQRLPPLRPSCPAASPPRQAWSRVDRFRCFLRRLCRQWKVPLHSSVIHSRRPRFRPRLLPSRCRLGLCRPSRLGLVTCLSLQVPLAVLALHPHLRNTRPCRRRPRLSPCRRPCPRSRSSSLPSQALP